MIILDENVPENQRQLLHSLATSCRDGARIRLGIREMTPVPVHIRCFTLVVTILVLIATSVISDERISSAQTTPKVSTPFLLAGGTGDQMSPSLAGNVMVYSHCPVRNCDIWGLDLTTRQAFPISEGAGDDRQPCTDGVRVVWQDGRNSGSRNEDNLLNDFDIYGAYLEDQRPFSTISNKTEDAKPPQRVGHHSSLGRLPQRRRLRRPGSGRHLHLRLPVLPRQGILLTTARSAQTRPVTNGRFVVWVDYRNEPNPSGLNADIYGYDLSTRQEFLISNAPDTQNDPAISGNIVVWSDFRKGADADIYGYDLSTKKEFLISFRTRQSDRAGHIRQHRCVARLSQRAGRNLGTNSDIYGYDLATEQEFPIYVAPGPQGFPRVSGNMVAWEDTSKGIKRPRHLWRDPERHRHPQRSLRPP